MKSDWYSSTIGEACLVVTDGSHFSPPSVQDGEYMVSVKDFTEYGFDFANCRRISTSDYEQLTKNGCVPQKGDVLVGKDGARYFEDIIIYKQPESPALLSSIAILRANPALITPEFLYYTLKTPIVKKDVRENYGSGSAIPRIVLKDFRRMPISFPSIQIQNRITCLVQRIDDKIELNNRINDNLEQQAAAVFHEMFIIQADPSWDEGTISDLGTVVGGSTPSKSKPEYYTEHGIAWITPKDLSVDKSKFISHGADDITELGLQNSSASLMPEGTVLFSSRAPIGYIAIADGEVTTNQGFKSVVPHANVGTAFVYYFLKSALPIIEGMASGSTFREISGSAMRTVPAVIPDGATLRMFSAICDPLFRQQRTLEKQNRELTAMRDTLLPKLMSGEIDVSNITV